ncbi:MAG: alkaline phosphatase family protein [Verrucomicrobiae bacterium]|nr:alkaline phosphatase family protein [Verrucomicrobiae bacterium]
MKRTAILNVVGLTPALLGEHTPRLREFAARGRVLTIRPVFPAVTCTAQATYLTGLTPAGHGIVGNGWYHRELAEGHFWKQSNHLVHGRKLWERLRAPTPITHHQSPTTNHQSPITDSPAPGARPFTCAKLFWWFNMYSSADYSITPRPIYPADGRKIFDIYTWPYAIRTEIKRDLGEFPFATFWGPAAGVRSSQGAPDAATRWIAEAAKWIETRFQPTLSLVYLPHLDYNLQRHGPFQTPSASGPKPGAKPSGAQRALNPAIVPDLRAVDAIVGDLLDFFHARDVQVVVLSEYGLTNVTTPIHLNRLFRQRGWLALKEELHWEQLDCGASRVFAVADHQIAHVYLNDPTLEHPVRELLEQCEGIEAVLGREAQAAWGVAHPRAGDLIAVAREHAWFTYYFWLDDARAPDYARTVDIHRKPGYDPVELFTDPALSPLALRAKIAWRLLQKKLGLRMLMDVIPLDASLVKGSHGRRPLDPRDWPVLICERGDWAGPPTLEATEVFDTLVRWVLD